MSVPDVFPDEATFQESASLPAVALPAETHPILGSDAGHVRQRWIAIDLGAYLQDISADMPCGLDLEYSPEYVELVRLMQGTPEVEYGKMHREAAEPDWKAVKAAAMQLLKQSRDLRLAVYLTQALLALHGLAGLADGLTLIDGLLVSHWDHVHPQLDPDDSLDSTERVNSLTALNVLVDPIRRAVLVRSVMYGAICLRDIEVAEGDVTPGKDEVPQKREDIEAAFGEAPVSRFEEIVEQAESAHERLASIESTLAERVGAHQAALIENPRKPLRRMADLFHPRLLVSPGEATQDDRGASARDVFQDGLGYRADHASGELCSRQDVALMLDRICDYYTRQEPGSPIPVLIRRARRLIDMDFMQIMSDLSPQSLAEINFLAGNHVTRDVGGDAAGGSFNPYGDFPHDE